ncbi:hypothetical protein CYMTET_32848, partial [Cymbomonas tetramitiformis]
MVHVEAESAQCSARGVFRNAKASARSEQQRRVINKVRVAAGEGIAADAADDNTCHVYDTSFWELQATLEGHTMCVYSCAWLDMGNLLATASFDSTVKIWDMRSHSAGHGSMVETLERPMNLHYRAYDVCGAPDTHTLVTSYGDASVRVWDMRMWGLLDTLRGHSRWVESMVLSSKVLVTASADTTVRLWNMASGADRVCSREDEEMLQIQEVGGQHEPRGEFDLTAHNQEGNPPPTEVSPQPPNEEEIFERLNELAEQQGTPQEGLDEEEIFERLNELVEQQETPQEEL